MDFVLGIGFCGAMLLAPDMGPSNAWARSRSADEHAAITYGEHIAPIILTHCASCHSPGQAAPFSLLNYDDVRSRAHLIGAAVASRVMPPWKPEPSGVRFVGERGLGAAEIRLIQDWIAQGAVEGDPGKLPPAPVWPEGWQLGQPDLVVKMLQPYVLGASGSDELRNFVVPVHGAGSEEDVNLARRAAALTSNQDLRILDVLSVAWTATGNFDAAGEVARSAISMAEQRRERSVAAAIRKRLRTYESSQSYVHDFVTGFGR